MSSNASTFLDVVAIRALLSQTTIKDLATMTCELLKDKLSCSSASFYSESRLNDDPVFLASTGEDSDQGVNLVREALVHGEPVLSNAADEHNSMVLPIGIEPVGGAIFCARPWPFTEFERDEAVTLAQLAFSCIAPLTARIETERALTLFLHEVTGPLSSVRGAIDQIERELSARIDLNELLRHNYFRDARSWIEFINGVIGNAALSGTTAPIPKPIPERTFLLSEVIAPAIRQVEASVRGKNLPLGRVRHESFNTIPPLWIDKRQFQQLAFNFLSNAIKYASPDRKSFEVLITAQRASSEIVLTFADWGIGLEPGLEEKVFERGFRAPTASVLAAGDGIGLWIVRRIIGAHGGTVTVTALREPTQFSVRLPESLTEPPRP